MKRYQIIVALNLSLIIVFMITGSYFCAFIFRFSGFIGFWFLHRKNNDDLSFIDDTFSKPLSHTNSCFHNFQENMNFQEAESLCKSKGMKLPSSDAKSDKFISILDQLRKCLYIAFFIHRCALLEIGRRTNFSMFSKTRLKDIRKYCKPTNCEIRYLPVTTSHLRVYRS